MGTTQANLLVTAPVSVQIMTFVGGSSQFPHTFLEVKDANGNIYDFGFAPQQQGQPYSLGEIYNDANHPFTNSSGPITLRRTAWVV